MHVFVFKVTTRLIHSEEYVPIIAIGQSKPSQEPELWADSHFRCLSELLPLMCHFAAISGVECRRTFPYNSEMVFHCCTEGMQAIREHTRMRRHFSYT